MSFNVFPAGVAMVFGAPIAPALAVHAPARQMQPDGAQSNDAPMPCGAPGEAAGDGMANGGTVCRPD